MKYEVERLSYIAEALHDTPEIKVATLFRTK